MSPIALDRDQWSYVYYRRALDPKPPQVLGWANINEWLDFLEGVINDKP